MAGSHKAMSVLKTIDLTSVRTTKETRSSVILRLLESSSRQNPVPHGAGELKEEAS
jgi:hypothetical protein